MKDRNLTFRALREQEVPEFAAILAQSFLGTVESSLRTIEEFGWKVFRVLEGGGAIRGGCLTPTEG